MVEEKECNCNICIKACHTRPGWFIPDQIPVLEAFFKKPLIELIGKGLAIDFDVRDNMVLVPNLKSNEGEEQIPYNLVGTCIFLDDDNNCKIHDVKPYECKEYMHYDSNNTIDIRHDKIGELWAANQDKLEEIQKKFWLYPHEPEGIGGILSNFI